KTFSIKNLVEFIKSSLKVVIIGYVAMIVVEKHIISLQLIPRVAYNIDRRIVKSYPLLAFFSQFFFCHAVRQARTLNFKVRHSVF
ncbi:MAG: EscU/YscU/HrcU family type III secretion system export apparatus switch protein, partial [Desulfamplus sp.]|nr:EscU/YscU/HrcU family type III secretion system export apparatus switch protein [Desulfamplus sp.]